MKEILLFYIVGIVLMFSLVVVANRGVKAQDIKIKPLILSILISLGSWISIYVIALIAKKQGF